MCVEVFIAYLSKKILVLKNDSFFQKIIFDSVFVLSKKNCCSQNSFCLKRKKKTGVYGTFSNI